MAKSKSFFGMRTGSTKSLTFQVNRGQQITKDRVSHVSNPRSTAQMRQRLTFAAAALFYKRAVQNLFKFAFEGKKQTESDYNAFMRANVALAPTLSKWMLDRRQYTPSIAPWVLSQGSLDTPNLTVDPGEKQLLALIAGAVPLNPTGGDVAKAILAQYPSLKDGDILTHVQVCASGISADDVAYAEDVDSFILNGGEDFSPIMQIRQVRLNVADTTPISNATSPWAEMITEAYMPDGAQTSCICFIGFKGLDEDYAEMGLQPYYETSRFMYGSSIIFSRPLAGGVKVSTSALLLNDETNKAYGIGRNDAWRNYAASSYETIEQTSADNILQGSLLDTEEKPLTDNIVGSTNPVLPSPNNEVGISLRNLIGDDSSPAIGTTAGYVVMSSKKRALKVAAVGSAIKLSIEGYNVNSTYIDLGRGSDPSKLVNPAGFLVEEVYLYWIY